MYTPPEYTPIVVAFKQPRKRKVQIKIFTDLRCPDPIITNRSRKLPEGAEILEIGVGTDFERIYKKKFKL